MRDTTVIMGRDIKFMPLQDPWQCSSRPSGRHMLEAGTRLRCEEDNVVGNVKFECVFGMDFVFCSSRTSI